MLRWQNRQEIRKIDLRPLRVQAQVLDTLWLTHPSVVEANFQVANIGDNRIGLVFAEGRLVDLVGPGQVAFYAKRLRKVAVQVLDERPFSPDGPGF